MTLLEGQPMEQEIRISIHFKSMYKITREVCQSDNLKREINKITLFQ